MITLENAKNTVMKEKYIKDIDNSELEIFSISENNSEWIFVINGIDKNGDLFMQQPFVRMVNKNSGAISKLTLSHDEDFIKTHTSIYKRKMSLKEAKKRISDWYSDYKIISIYESINYFKFVIKFEFFKLDKLVFLNRDNYKLLEVTKTNNEIAPNEAFNKIY